MKGKTLDYDLEERLVLTTAEQLKALGHPIRNTILGLLHERAASVTELSKAMGRPKSTVAYHVKVLTSAGMLRVVRSKRVRAIDEAFYGRTARMFVAALEESGQASNTCLMDFNDFEVAARESQPAYADGQLWGFIRHARITEQQKEEFWHRMVALVDEFDQLPRHGNLVHGIAVGIYPIEGYPQLPQSDDETR